MVGVHLNNSSSWKKNSSEVNVHRYIQCRLQNNGIHAGKRTLSDFVDLCNLVLYLVELLLELSDLLAVLGDEVEVIVLCQLIHSLTTLLNLYLCLLLSLCELSLTTMLGFLKNLRVRERKRDVKKQCEVRFTRSFWSNIGPSCCGQHSVVQFSALSSS